jgi:sec-independent protein translocase protein TatA
MFGSLGGPEIVLILVIALIVFGPRRLPDIGKSMGKMLAEFRKASNDFKRTIEEEVEAEKIRESIQSASVPEPTPSKAAEPTPEPTSKTPDQAGAPAEVPAPVLSESDASHKPTPVTAEPIEPK